MQTKTLSRNEHLTFKGNLSRTRYGWLRLTPAYSVHVVAGLLDSHVSGDDVVLDPFCGTGTTALACAERGIRCDTTDINLFLLWLSWVKCRSYDEHVLDTFKSAAAEVAEAFAGTNYEHAWTPPISQIEKWWDSATLQAIARAMACINDLAPRTDMRVIDLLKLAFCRTIIELANVSFGHQSMSFKRHEPAPMLAVISSAEQEGINAWFRAVADIEAAATQPLISEPRFLYCDARDLTAALADNTYSCVITSPPYPNRMSYIRELRPYMYWLGYLNNGREAGELDWQAIGGTWGCATSNVGRWKPDNEIAIPVDWFSAVLDSIAETSPLLSNYVRKYFYDMSLHCESLFRVLRGSGVINYIVGNSKFYDVLLPVESLFAAMFEKCGFVDVNVSTIRKRTSKKELFEFVVAARKPHAEFK